MHRLSTAAIALLIAFASHPVAAQSLEEITKAEEGVIAAWEATPLSFRKAIFVDEAVGFGIYKARGAEFKPGEPVVVYAEPVGYGWQVNADSTYTFGFDADLVLKTPDGEVVATQENFAQVALTSAERNREFMLTLSLELTDAPAGDYVIEYVTRDIASEKSATLALPFTITE